MLVRRKKYVCTSICWMLNSPAKMRLRTHWWLGLKRRVWPHIATLPACFCSVTTAWPSLSASHSGISTCTCLPALRHEIVCSACICVGVARITASRCLIFRLSSSSVVTCPMPYLSATSLVLSYSRPTTEITFTSSMFFIASRCLMPNAPAPASATWMVMSVLQDQVPDGRVRRRHVVEAMRHLGRRAAGHVGHRATGDEPHHELDAFTAGFAHVVDVRHLRQARRVCDQAVEEPGVPVL